MQKKEQVVVEPGKEKCPDCHQCQMCSKSRCRLCRQESPEPGHWELGTGFTYGRYLDWKRGRKDEQETPS
ncbi:MAG: hypothetical protein JXL84_05070 [Deltaproteobacteria bacterium]|nr:hypothetical protein [Deltaproteobacteria bacterium]